MRTKKVLNFKVVIHQDEDGIFVVDCPSIPGCHTQGDSYEEAIEHIKEAIKLCLKVAKTDKEYRDLIDFGEKKRPRFIGISDVILPRPSFL